MILVAIIDLMTKQDLINLGIRVERIEDTIYIIERTSKKGTKDLKPSIRHGVWTVQFRDGNKVKTLSVSKIVYIWEHGKLDEGMTVMHLDGDPKNLRSNNLRAVTRKELLLWKLLKMKD